MIDFKDPKGGNRRGKTEAAKRFPLKVYADELTLWKKEAAKTGKPLAQYIRDAVRTRIKLAAIASMTSNVEE